MARPIDEKIVVMKMDNQDLVTKAADTTSLLGKLKDSLNKIPGVNLGKTATEMSNIRTEADRTNLNRLAESVQMVSSRFTTMGIVGVTALTNIVNRAVDAGLAITKSLTFDQVSSGFQEYELKMKSIGTMLANTEWAGSTLTDVKKTLGELNDYADKTIYSFGEMTSSIGRFTAAGVTLEDSAIAIKGLGNLAAVSGSTSEQLNTAMYQASQALASGRLTLEDWNSMVNAGMAGKKTQDALIETAKAMGKNIDLSDGFRSSIQDGWLTSEVFLETLKKFGADESMTKAATSVRTFSGMMDSLKEGIGSGWAETFEHIFGDFEEATVFWTDMSNAVSGWFAKSTEARNNLVKGIADGGGFMNIFDGLQNAIKPVMQVFEAIGNGFDRAFPPKSAAQIVTLTKAFKDFTAGLKIGKGTMGQLTTIFQGAFSVLSTVLIIATQLGKAFLNLIPDGAGGGVLNFLEKIARMAIEFNKSVKEGNGLTKTIELLGKGFGALGNFLKDVVGNTGAFVSGLIGSIGPALNWLKEKLAPVGEWFKDAFSDMGGDDLLGAGTLAGVITAITLFGSKLFSIFDSLGEIGENFGEMLEGVKDSVQAFAMGIKIANLVLIAGALTMLAISLKLMEGIKTEDLTKGITALAVSLGVMMAGMAVISKFNIVGGLKASVTLVAMATAVTIMAVALRSISDLNPDELKQGIMGLAGIVGTLAAAIVVISKLGGKIGAGSVQLIALAGAVSILANAVGKLAEIEVGDLKTSIIALGVIFAEIAIFMKVVNGVKLGPGSAVGLLGMAAAIQLMVGAIGQIGRIDKEALIQGLITIAALLAQIAIFSMVAGGPQMMLAGAGIVMIAGALMLLIPSVQTLGAMSWEELVKGLGGMAIALGAVAAAGILASGAIGGAIAIGIMAASLNLLVGPIQALANLTWGELIKSLVALAAGLGLIAGAAILLAPVTPAIAALGASIALFGIAALAAGAGIALFGTGLATLATLTAASVAAIVSALGLLLKGLAELIPAVVKFVVDLGIALAQGLRDLIPPVVDTILFLITELLRVITEHLPRFLELGVQIIVQLLEGIGQYVPVLVDACMQAIIDVINGMANAVQQYGPELISAVFNLLGEIILLVVEAGIQTVNALFGWIPGVEKATSEIGKAAEEYIRQNFGAEKVGKEKGQEFIKSLEATKPGAKASGVAIGEGVKEGVKTADLLSAGKLAGSNFAAGISQSAPSVRTAAAGIASAADQAIKQRMGIQSPAKETIKSGEWTGEGYAKGITNKKEKVKKSAKNVASAAAKEFNKRMDAAEYKFKMGTINANQYVAEIEKIKKAYAKYPELVQKADLEIQKIRKKSSDDQMKSLENQYKLGQITSEKYIAELKKMEAAYAKQPLEVQKIQLKIQKVEEEAAKKREELRKKELDKSKEFISERKYYNEMSLAAELAAWERVQKKFEAGTSQRKEADREVYRLKNEINSKLISMNEEYTEKIDELQKKEADGIKALNDEYDNALKDRSNSLANFVGIFDEVTVNAEISGAQLLSNLKGQLATFQQWTANIQSLASRGVDSSLLETLREMGPKAAGEIAALNTLTDTQLAEYSDIWKQKNELAKTEAMGQLEKMREDTNVKIANLRTDTAKQLDIYKTEWLKRIKEIKTGTTGEFVSLTSDMNVIALNAMDGLKKGLEAKRPEVLELANQIASEIAAAMAAALETASPSKVTTRIGGWAGDGLVVGLDSRVKDVRKSARNLAVTAKDSINEFIQGLEIPDMDNTVHIQAVIDYDKSSLDHISKSLAIIPDLSYANASLEATRAHKRQNDDKEASRLAKSKVEDRSVHIEQKMTFNSRQLSPSEVARQNLKASRQLVAQLPI